MRRAAAASAILAQPPNAPGDRRCPFCRRRSLEKIADLWPRDRAGLEIRAGDGVYRCRACGRELQFGPEHPPGAI